MEIQSGPVRFAFWVTPRRMNISGTEGFGFMEDQAVNEAVRIILELPAEKQNELWDRLKSIGIIKE